MPSPPTTSFPLPRSWDEFEDICVDVLKQIWSDPYVTRNGRSGQSQDGVDCFGLPRHLGGPAAKKYAGAQCKLTEALTFAVVQEEVDKATTFEPRLSEYVMMTTAPRDSTLQEEVRTHTWPFDRVLLMFWPDISDELSGHADLLEKHFPDWMRRSVTETRVMEMLMTSTPEDFSYNDGDGTYFLASDVALKIVLYRSDDSDDEFVEPWVSKFPNRRGIRQPVHIYYGATKVLDILCVYVDGFRHIIPLPTRTTLTLTPFKYHLGQILNAPILGYGFDHALRRAGISVSEEDV